MQTIAEKLKPAQDEVRRTAHDQDLTEVPKRARLDREAENSNNSQYLQARIRESDVTGV